MSEVETVIEDILSGETDVEFLGHVTYPLWKVLSVFVPFVLCGVYLFERKCFPSIYPGIATTSALTMFAVCGLSLLLVDLDLRKKYQALYSVRIVLVLSIFLLPLLAEYRVMSLEQLRGLVLKVPVLSPFRWLGVTFVDVVLVLMAVVGARAAVRLHAMDAVWFSRFLVRKGLVPYYWGIVVTYLVCRKYTVNGVREAWQASKAVRRRVRGVKGPVSATIAQLEVFSLRLANQFAECANLVIALLGNVGIMDASYSSAAKFKFVIEDYVYPVLLVLLLAFVWVSFGVA